MAGDFVVSQCPKCSGKLKIPAGYIKPEATRFRCPSCGNVFFFRQSTPPREETVAAPPAHAQPSSERPETVKEKSLSFIEMRKQKRVPFREEVLLNYNILVKGVDISEGGMYVYTGRSFNVGSTISVTFPSRRDDHGKLTLKARVQHNQAGTGMGLMFVETDEAQKNVLKGIVEEVIKDAGDSMARKRVVLLVEDNDNTRRIFQSKLVEEGFTVLEAKDGYEALMCLGTQVPDLVVLDYHIDGIDGLKVLSSIKESPIWAKIPVLVLSADVGDEITDKAYSLGAEMFLPKNVTPPARLVELINKTIE